MKSILYTMHVPWSWIKQRPHFIAEHLSENYTVHIFYKRPWNVKKSNLKQNLTDLLVSNFIVFPFERIPILRKFIFPQLINKLLIKFYFRNIESYDFLWITSWAMYRYLENIIPVETKVIFDCMDDELEFPNIRESPHLLKAATLIEQRLIDRADVIFCSSEYLKQKIIYRNNIQKEIYVINNAVEITEGKKIEIFKDRLATLKNIAMYIGAISEWFDFESILFSLENNPELNIVLVGPLDVVLPTHDRIHYLGTVQRDYIFSIMNFANVLIMPFVTNELIKSVNPVKLYEYIHMSKPVLASRYMESEKFEEYIYLYSDKYEFSNVVNQCLNGRLYSKKTLGENREFISQNTWSNRVSLISSILHKKFS